MANTCTTEINVNASESAIDWFENLVKNYTTEDFIGQFGSGAELFIDKVGSKWITLMDQYRVESQKYFLDFIGEPKESPRRMQEGIYTPRLRVPNEEVIFKL